MRTFILFFLILVLTPAWAADLNPALEGEDKEIYYSVEQLEVFPRPLKEINLPYPATAAAKRIDGQVLLQLFIDESGIVTDASIIEANPVGVFEEITLKTFRMVTFSPGIRQGRSVKSRIRIRATYRYGNHEGK